MKVFKHYLLEAMLQLLWKQWSAVGIYSNIEEEYSFNIDPESLLCATCSFGRFDQRLFDEAIVWLRDNGHLLNIDRLKTVIKNFEEYEIKTLGAIAEYLVIKEKKRKWDRVVRFCAKTKKEKDAQKYFLSKDFNSLPVIGKPDKIFQKWGLLRSEVNLPQTKHILDFERPSNILFKLRSFFGVNARADICAFLLFCKEDNSLQISKKVNFNQRSVYQVLNQLYASGLLEKKYAGQRSLYTVDKEHWNTFLKFDGSISYVIWSKIFSPLAYLFKQILEYPELSKDAYLTSSKLREISEVFVPEIEASGLSTSGMPAKNKIGESFTPHFENYVKEILNQLLLPLKSSL